MRFSFVMSEMGIGLRRNLSMTIALIITIAISLSMLGAAFLIREQVNISKTFWYGKVEVSVFLRDDISPAQQDAIDNELKALPQVEHIYYESKEQAYEHFKEDFPDALVKSTPKDALPASFRVKLVDPKQYDVVASAVALMPGVQTVIDANAQLNKMFSFFDTIQQMAVGVSLIVFGAAILLIANTVRLSAFSRRRETAIMRLVGASDIYIQGPFVLEGALAGLIGAVLSMGLVALFKWRIIDNGIHVAFGDALSRYISWHNCFWTFPWLALLGIVVTGITSAIALQRYLRV